MRLICILLYIYFHLLWPSETKIRKILAVGCPNLALPNGRVRYWSTFARLSCAPNHILVGDTVLTCSNGTWIGTTPICAHTANKCPKFGKVSNGATTYYNRGVFAKTVCEQGFKLLGSSVMYCADNGWNDTAPICHHLTINPVLCTFEPDRKCGWFMKAAAFNWNRVSSMEESPLRDHTYDEVGEGHFLYLDAIARPTLKYITHMLKYGDEAKLYSPMYPATSPEEKYCLIFYHYSFGFTPGTVRVKINNDTMWLVTGNDNDKWNRVLIPIPRQFSPFRITIEGSGMLGEYSHTAIDDVGLKVGEECEEKDEIPTSTTETTEFSTEENSHSTSWNTPTAAQSVSSDSQTSASSLLQTSTSGMDTTPSTSGMDTTPSTSGMDTTPSRRVEVHPTDVSLTTEEEIIPVNARGMVSLPEVSVSSDAASSSRYSAYAVHVETRLRTESDKSLPKKIEKSDGTGFVRSLAVENENKRSGAMEFYVFGVSIGSLVVLVTIFVVYRQNFRKFRGVECKDENYVQLIGKEEMDKMRSKKEKYTSIKVQ